ncbi:hypothetical protein [Bacillus sp. FJAT-45037]|uniref:hypothetical protein n=1 Tax=Bacillus sp. FJAT-45037 TaxID=2011007 RepID=UPI0012FDF65F|nr:hypothetical protein [Bacillus sp. FJAT-45037]
MKYIRLFLFVFVAQLLYFMVINQQSTNVTLVDIIAVSVIFIAIWRLSDWIVTKRQVG